MTEENWNSVSQRYGHYRCRGCDSTCEKEWRNTPDTKEIRYCRICNTLLTGINWTVGNKRNKCYLCKKCNCNKQKEWRKKHAEVLNNKAKIRHAVLKRQVLTVYGNVCVLCGENTYEFLSIDHTKNDGYLSKGESTRSGRGLYLKIKREGFPKGKYQILCMSCQYIKKQTALQNNPQVAHQRKLKVEVLKRYSSDSMCACCDACDIRVLQLDHSFNDGSNVRHAGVVDLYGYLKKRGFPQDLGLRVLCANCNFAKGHFGYCPHRNLPEDKLVLIPEDPRIE